jgi:hypothetical protein
VEALQSPFGVEIISSGSIQNTSRSQVDGENFRRGYGRRIAILVLDHLIMVLLKIFVFNMLLGCFFELHPSHSTAR